MSLQGKHVLYRTNKLRRLGIYLLANHHQLCSRHSFMLLEMEERHNFRREGNGIRLVRHKGSSQENARGPPCYIPLLEAAERCLQSKDDLQRREKL